MQAPGGPTFLDYPLDVVFSVLFYHDTVWLKADLGVLIERVIHADDRSRMRLRGARQTEAESRAQEGSGEPVDEGIGRGAVQGVLGQVQVDHRHGGPPAMAGTNLGPHSLYRLETNGINARIVNSACR